MLKDSFSFLSILKVLAEFRAKEANLRRRKSFYWQRFNVDLNPSDLVFSDIAQYLPPRRAWARPSKKHRDQLRQPIVEVQRDSIIRKVQGVYYSGRLLEFDWGRKLSELTARIQKRIADGDFKFYEPELILRTKAVGLGCRPRFRCISMYHNTEDRVILSIANRYLSSKFDGSFLDTCYAFRAGKNNPAAQAIKKIIDFRATFSTSLYVAECDIFKFFDTIDHDVVLKIFDARCAELGLDVESKLLIKGFLDSYDIRNVKKCAFWEKLSKSDDWNFIADLPEDRRFGLPQGGALSGLLSNLVLSSLDRAVDELKEKNLLYLRYCDDIMILSRDKSLCKKVFDICGRCLESMNLKMHHVDFNLSYGAEYFIQKSKRPFLWANLSSEPAAMPWVSFLGYSIHFDGSVRLRKETLLGHVKSIQEECSSFLFYMRKLGLRQGVDKEKAIEDFMYRLLAKGIGRIAVSPLKSSGRCWIGTFRFVGESKKGLKQMRYLDYIRSSEIAGLLRKLGIKRRVKDVDHKLLYFGKPFSYYGSSEACCRNAIVAGKHFVPLTDARSYNKDLNILDEQYPTSGWERASGR